MIALSTSRAQISVRIFVGLLVVRASTGCGAPSKRMDSVEKISAVAVDRRCSDVPAEKPLRIASPVMGPGSMNLSFDVPSVDTTIANIRDWPPGAMNGSTVSSRMEVADTTDAQPLPCSYTAVFEDKACVLEATGTRYATRTLRSFPSGTVEDAKWRLIVEAVDSSGCTEKRNLLDVDHCVVVEWSWQDLRLVGFEQGPNYSGGAGSHGALVDFDGRDLRPEIQRWPKDEQARYMRGPGFSALASKEQDLFWFGSMDDLSSGAWSYRLRDREGSLLLDHDVKEGRRVPLATRRTLVRQGPRLFYLGAGGFRRIR